MNDSGGEPERARAYQKYKKVLIGVCLVALFLVSAELLFFKFHLSNPLPDDIKQQITYKAVYPSAKTGSLNQPGYQYQAGQKTLTFTVHSAEADLAFTEQPAPSNLGSGNQIYFPAIGLHPYAQFQSKLGPVALAKFYQSGDLKPTGQSAVLVSQGTLVIIHSGKDLTNEQWKNLANSLNIGK